MVPHRRRAVVVVVLEHGASGGPRLAELGLGERAELLVLRAHPGVAVRNMARLRQVPRLRVAVALLVAVAAVEVGHDRHRAAVRVVVAAMPIAAVDAAGRVGPVERLVDRKQVRPEAAVRLHELVDPLDAHWPTPRRLDREGRIVERLRMVDRAVAPHLGRAQTHPRRQDLLLELAHPDPVVVDPPSLHAVELAAARHRRRDHQRRRILRNRRGVEHAGPERLRPRPAADEAPHQKTSASPSPGLHQPPSRDRRRDERPIPLLIATMTHLETSSASPALLGRRE